MASFLDYLQQQAEQNSQFAKQSAQQGDQESSQLNEQTTADDPEDAQQPQGQQQLGAGLGGLLGKITGTQTAMGNGTATDAPPPDAPASAPSATPSGVLATPAAPVQGDGTNGTVAPDIPVTGKPQPKTGVQLQLPQTQNMADPDPAREKGDDLPANYTPAEMASSKTPNDDNGNPIEHKGLFGQKGLLRDILGTLGDGLLVNSGNKAVYAPQRQQEKESDALVGFAQNPAASIGRLAAVNPELAIKYQNQVVNQELSQGRIDQASQKLGASKGAAAMRVYGQISQAYATATTPQAKQAALANLENLRQTSNLGSDVLPDITDQNAGVNAMSYTPTVNQGQQKIDQTQSNQGATQALGKGRLAETTRHDKEMEKRPTAGSQPRAPTAASMAAPMLARVLAAERTGKTPDPADLDGLSRLNFNTSAKPKASGMTFGNGIPGSPAATAAPKLPTGASHDGLTPAEVSQGIIMYNGQKLRPKR